MKNLKGLSMKGILQEPSGRIYLMTFPAQNVLYGKNQILLRVSNKEII